MTQEFLKAAGSSISPPRSRITIKEIADDLSIGLHSVYGMLERGIIPGIKLGRGWLVTLHAYGEWKRTCGTKTA